MTDEKTKIKIITKTGKEFYAEEVIYPEGTSQVIIVTLKKPFILKRLLGAKPRIDVHTIHQDSIAIFSEVNASDDTIEYISELLGLYDEDDLEQHNIDNIEDLENALIAGDPFTGFTTGVLMDDERYYIY